MKRFYLSYTQPVTNRAGKVVSTKAFYVSHRPGDGGVDWGYTLDAHKAVPLSDWFRRRFIALHGSKATAWEAT